MPVKSKQERIADIVLECADMIRSARVPDKELLFELEDILFKMKLFGSVGVIPCATLEREYLDKFKNTVPTVEPTEETDPFFPDTAPEPDVTTAEPTEENTDETAEESD